MISHGCKDEFSVRELLLPLFKNDLKRETVSTDFMQLSRDSVGLSAFTSTSAPLPLGATRSHASEIWTGK
jgi:hypothetical protein